MSFHEITARLNGGIAEIGNNNRRYPVSLHDESEDNAFCPKDYLAGALGS